MSTVMVIAPVVIANWGAISAAVTTVATTLGAATAVAGTVGFAHAKETNTTSDTELAKKIHRAEIEVDNSEILGEGTGLNQEIVVQKDGYLARFTRDARGALKVCVEGNGYSKSQLKQIGEDLIGRVTQQYAYHRIMTEMKERNMTVVHEEVDADQTVRIRVKNW